MTLEQLHKELTYVNAARENRLKYANIILNDLSLLPKLIEILLMVDDKTSCKAAWILEFACAKNLDIIIPHLDKLIGNIHKIHLDSAVRPMSKICEFLVKAYYSKTNNLIKSKLQPKHKELIIENSFDWMITDQKVAAKVYSMSNLQLLGQDYDWIHAELKIILERDYHPGSSAYKARARQVLHKINKRSKT